MLSANTRLFALLGDPVAHSLSPLFQNAGFRAAGLDAVYVALRVTAVDLPIMMQTLTNSGGGGNITVPHKQAAAIGGALPTERVQQLGAANVFAASDAGMVLDNTDVDGILAALDRLEAAGDAWCVIGTGGSARAVAGAARERGVSLAVQSRSLERAAEFSEWALRLGVPRAEVPDCQVVINSTPLGLGVGDALPAPPSAFPSVRVGLDLTYRATGSTPWCDAFRAAGLRAGDGREVLLHQGAASWRRWFPQIAPPIEVMRAALDGYMA